MELFLKCVGGALVGVVLILALGRKDLGLLLAMAVCVMIALSAVRYLEPVMDLLDKLQSIGGIDGDLVVIVLRAVGISLVTEIAGLICTDSGNASLAKIFQILGVSVVLWISLPIFEALLTLIQEILEGL